MFPPAWNLLGQCRVTYFSFFGSLYAVALMGKGDLPKVPVLRLLPCYSQSLGVKKVLKQLGFTPSLINPCQKKLKNTFTRF